MAFTEDEEILQDFLIEAGEILEKLNEQLVDLENSPDDNELLNAVFRGFHTIKGGASFLSLTSVVEVCHRSEDVFNLLRNGERQVNSDLMDVILPVLDVLNSQFDSLNSAQEPVSASAELLSSLDRIISGETEDSEATTQVEEQVVEQAAEIENNSQQQVNSQSPGSEEGDMTDEEFEMILDAAGNKSSAGISKDVISDDEFENMLDNLHGSSAPGKKETAQAKTPQEKDSASDVISDDEFENLLDSLHGSSAPGKAVASADKKPAPEPKPVPENNNKTSNNEEITDDEFEALLDSLHGKPEQNKTDAAQKIKPLDIKAPASKQTKKETPVAVTDKKPAKKESAAQADTTVRVDTKRLDEIMNLVGELVLVRNRMSRLEKTYNDEELEKVVSNFDLVTTDLQTAVMKTRMQPIKKVFGRFPRVIRDLARSLDKKVNLVLVGEETDLDKNLVDALADPLVHLVRNSVDHGIELPEVRKKNGKDETGTVTLSAKQEGDHISLLIEDDGAGMDPNKLKELAISKGVLDEDAASRLSDKDCYNLIFAAGFSTKEVISDVSGRGVGMDVVKNSITQLNGTVEIDSQMGKGSKLTIKVPLTLAILPTLMIMINDQVFALPLVNVGEIINLDLTEFKVIDGQQVLMVRDKVLPIFYLRRWLSTNNLNNDMPDEGHVVIVSIGSQQVGFVVDKLVGQEEVVIKPLGATLSGTRGLAGATITGDGKIALILDVPELMAANA